MICVVTGPPGAGKTLYTVQKIAEAILAGKFVATNVKLAEDWPERVADTTILRFRKRARAAKCAEWRRRMVYVETLGELARVRLGTAGFEGGKLEGRGVAVFDEAGEALDSRAWNEDKERRRADNRFMRQHRKLGWDVFLVAQEEEQLDARVRGMAEYLIRLRNLKREPRILGVSIGAILPRPVILALWAWHGVKTSRPARKEVFTLRKRIAGMYDTHQLVGGDEDAEDVIWLPLSDGQPSAVPDAGGPARLPAGGVTVAGIAVGPPIIDLARVPLAAELTPSDGASDPTTPLTSPTTSPAPPAAAASYTPPAAPQAPLAPLDAAFPSAPGSGVATVTALNAERPPLPPVTAPAADVMRARRGPGQRYPAR